MFYRVISLYKKEKENKTGNFYTGVGDFYVSFYEKQTVSDEKFP